MTCLAFLTDVHGNYPALQAVQQDMHQFKPDQVIVGGDLINGAPFNREVLETVFSEHWTVIRGNHEFYVLNQNTARAKRAHQESPQIKWLKDDVHAWKNKIAAMPDELTLYYGDLPSIRVVHGIPGNNRQAFHPYISDEKARKWLQDVESEILIFGHYHIAVDRQVDQWHLLNPGAVGTPHDGLRHANYLILQSKGNVWRPIFRQVPYDFDLVEERFEETGIVKKIKIMGLLSYLQVKFARPLINGFVDWFINENLERPFFLEDVEVYLSNPDIMFHSFAPQSQVNRQILEPIPPSEYEHLL